MSDQRTRGLPSIEKARQDRRSSRGRRPPIKYVLWSGLVLTVVLILHWRFSQSELEEQRQGLMAKQRAVEVELGKHWYPIRDQVEGWSVGLSEGVGDEIVDTEALKDWDFLSMPGLYLRVNVSEASDAAAIRKNAKSSLRDAFTACLIRYKNPDILSGKECERTRDCPTGEFCNEMDHCSRPTQPYNLRVAYRTMHVLSDDWVREVQDASTDLRVKLLETMFDDATRDDIPMAADLLTRAKYFLLVLDEGPPSSADAGDDEPVDNTVHPARIGVWRLEDGKNVLRLKREAAAALVGSLPTDEKVEAARNRQANSCALALEVRRALGDKTVPSLPDQAPADPSPSPSAAGDADAGDEVFQDR